MKSEQHKAYLHSLVEQADAAVERIVVALDKLRRLEREMRSLDKRADDVEKETSAHGMPMLDMVADEVRSRKANVFRSSAHLARSALEMARESADSAMKVRNAMEQTAREPAAGIGAWSVRREMRRSLGKVQAWAITCEDAAQNVDQAQDRVKFEV